MRYYYFEHENDKCSRFSVHVLISKNCMFQSIDKITGNISFNIDDKITLYARNDDQVKVLTSFKRKFELFPVK